MSETATNKDIKSLKRVLYTQNIFALHFVLLVIICRTAVLAGYRLRGVQNADGQLVALKGQKGLNTFKTKLVAPLVSCVRPIVLSG